MKYLKVIIGIIIFFFLLISCEKEEILNSDTSSGFISEGIWAGEYWPTDEWRFCNPEEVGMNSKKLNELDDEIQLLLKLHFDVHSVLIVKDGYIVAEKYYTGDFNADSLHPVYSCTKSVTSYLIGISIEMGNIPGMNTRMVDFFPEYEIQNLSPQKEQITLEHLLTMSAGLEWYELEYKYSDERNTFRQWNNSDDKVKFVLDQHMVAIPGEEYSYNTGISHVLSAIIQKSTGIRTDSFAIKQLFNPLGINDYYWPVDSKGVAFGGARLWLKPRDMAKFGYLFLKNGIWDGQQLVSKNWVIASQQKHIPRKYIPDSYYGYHWWVSNNNYYSAVGFGGQWITVVPDQNLVVVFTNYFTEGESLQWETPERLLETYILPAIK